MDMNLLYKPKALDIIKELGSKKVNNKKVVYELICGIDYRYLTQELANALKENRFINIRIAWDWSFGKQKLIKSCIEKLRKAGYKNREIMVFILCNWKIPYSENLLKLDLCKVWNVRVADSYFDNQTTAETVKPIFWTEKEIKDFRHKCRKHNQYICFGIDPDYTRGRLEK